MTLALWGLALSLIAAVVGFTGYQFARYRHDQRTRSDLYPYTRRRLAIRTGISTCLVGEILLLVALWPTISAQRPIWFVVYVTLVLLLALGMVVLAFLDLGETQRQRGEGHKRLFAEFVHEVQAGEKSGDPH